MFVSSAEFFKINFSKKKVKEFNQCTVWFQIGPDDL